MAGHRDLEVERRGAGEKRVNVISHYYLDAIVCCNVFHKIMKNLNGISPWSIVAGSNLR